MQRASMAEVRSTYKTRDAWWTVLLVDPLAGPLVRFASAYRWITPDLITIVAFLFGLGAAAAYLQADRAWLVAGAVLYYVSFLLDCVDGKVARLRHNGTILGRWLDFILDRLRVVVVTMALMGGQYLATGRGIYLLMATIVVFLAMFQYVNSAQTNAIHRQLEAELELARSGARPPAQPPEAQRGAAAAAGADASPPGLPAALAPLAPIRDHLARHRIRAHLVSGVEFEMFTLIVGPLTGWIIVIPAIAGAAMLLFEAMFVYRLWLAARRASRELAVLGVAETAVR